jgi:hypothetical protein
MVAAALVFSLLPAGTALAADEIYPMVFPVEGAHYLSHNFGADRGDHIHIGEDIMVYGVKGLPVRAAAPGTIDWMPATSPGPRCCALSIVHDDGWETWYIHLNNDTPGTDDGLGWGIAPGIAPGVHVEAGQVIGYTGDSGNAEEVAPHLHFELHRPDGTPIDPYPSLVAAEAYFRPPFRDDEGSVHEDNIIYLSEQGVTTGCGTELYCPSKPVTRAQMAAFLTRALELSRNGPNPFSDVPSGLFEDEIVAIYEAAITQGCAEARYCPGDPVNRGQMASFIDRAFDLPDTSEHGTFSDVAGIHADAIDRLAAAGITTGCTDTEYCPYDVVTRAQMASFIARALQLGG